MRKGGRRRRPIVRRIIKRHSGLLDEPEDFVCIQSTLRRATPSEELHDEFRQSRSSSLRSELITFRRKIDAYADMTVMTSWP